MHEDERHTGDDHHHHDHDHDNSYSDMQARVRALETLLTEKGLIDPAAIDAIVETYETKVGPRNGAQVVAKAWSDPDFFAGGRGATDVTQKIQRLRTGELLADEAGNEAASAKFPARFHAAIDSQQIAPWRRQRFANDQVAEDDSPAI